MAQELEYSTSSGSAPAAMGAEGSSVGSSSHGAHAATALALAAGLAAEHAALVVTQQRTPTTVPTLALPGLPRAPADRENPPLPPPAVPPPGGPSPAEAAPNGPLSTPTAVIAQATANLLMNEEQFMNDTGLQVKRQPAGTPPLEDAKRTRSDPGTPRLAAQPQSYGPLGIRATPASGRRPPTPVPRSPSGSEVSRYSAQQSPNDGVDPAAAARAIEDAVGASASAIAIALQQQNEIAQQEFREATRQALESIADQRIREATQLAFAEAKMRLERTLERAMEYLRLEHNKFKTDLRSQAENYRAELKTQALAEISKIEQRTINKDKEIEELRKALQTCHAQLTDAQKTATQHESLILQVRNEAMRADSDREFLRQQLEGAKAEATTQVEHLHFANRQLGRDCTMAMEEIKELNEKLRRKGPPTPPDVSAAVVAAKKEQHEADYAWFVKTMNEVRDAHAKEIKDLRASFPGPVPAQGDGNEDYVLRRTHQEKLREVQDDASVLRIKLDAATARVDELSRGHEGAQPERLFDDNRVRLRNYQDKVEEVEGKLRKGAETAS